MAQVARNEPCPCGSGKRFKECHGAHAAVEVLAPAGPAVSDRDERLGRAWQRFHAGDFDGARALAGEVATAMPEHPGAHRLIGRCESERGHAGAALRALLRAARGLRAVPVPSGEQYAVWTELGSMFVRALAGIGPAFAAAKRREYAGWLGALPERCSVAPLVSIVLVVPQREPWLEEAIDSVRRQSYRNLELIVVHASDDPALRELLGAALSKCPFPHRVLSKVGAAEPELVNAGVRAAQGAFVNLLHVRHRLAPERIERLVEEIAQRGLAWGFTDVEFSDADGRPVGPGADGRILRWRERLAWVAQADTVGHAFLSDYCVAVGPSNLFFSKALFEELGGMRDLPLTYVWDFCLRAVWLAEPLRIGTQLYRHRLTASDVRAPSDQAAFEAAQVQMFRDYYAKACAAEQVAPNPFAPCLHHWRLQFLKAVFMAGHVLTFDVERLEQLGEMIPERREPAGELAPGLDLLGPAFGEFGLGESMRALANACAAGGIPFGVRDVDIRLLSRQAERSMDAFLVDRPTHRCTLYCMNPDLLKLVGHLASEIDRTGIYRIGYWYWELDRLPGEWTEALDRVDEVWVATEFVAEAVRLSTAKPVVKIPPPIEVKPARGYTRADFRLPENRFLFLFTFDFNSYSTRKNPEGAVRAFQRAFGNGRSDVGLVVKCVNATLRPEMLQALEDLIGADDRIVLLHEFFSRDQVSGLESVVDSYVSLHRAEGLGMGLAESMYLGKPVIGTAYSGNLEFMNEDNSCLVDFELVPVRKGEYLYHDERFRWAEPDVEHAAHHMRRLVDDGAFRARIARNGQLAIRSRFTPAVTAALIRRRLEELGML